MVGSRTPLILVYKLTWLVVDDGRFAVIRRKDATSVSIAFVFRQPRVTLEEVTFALGRHVHLHFFNEPPAAFQHAVMTQLQKDQTSSLFDIYKC